jgi:hypothetical protein
MNARSSGGIDHLTVVPANFEAAERRCPTCGRDHDAE